MNTVSKDNNSITKTNFNFPGQKNVYKGKVKLLHSSMEGKTAAICGAAALIWENEKKKQL